MNEPLIIRMRDIRAAKMCGTGTRKWFLKQGFDWSDFLVNGIDAQKFIDTGDGMALKVVELARGKQ